MIFKQNNHRKWLAIVLLIAFFFLEIMIVSDNSFFIGLDYSVQNIFNTIVTPINTKVFSTITFLGSPVMDVIYLVIMMFLLYRQGKKGSSLWIGFILISGNIIAFLVKTVVRRQRPTGKIIPASGYSFPSGHVFGTTLVILTLILLILPYLKNQSTAQIIKILLVVWLIVVAISRVYLRGHFLSDVVGSALLAGTWWECCELLYLRYYETINHFLKIEAPKE